MLARTVPRGDFGDAPGFITSLMLGSDTGGHQGCTREMPTIRPTNWKRSWENCVALIDCHPSHHAITVRLRHLGFRSVIWISTATRSCQPRARGICRQVLALRTSIRQSALGLTSIVVAL